MLKLDQKQTEQQFKMKCVIDNPIGRSSTFSRPPNLNDFVNSAPVAPASSDNGKTTTITQEMLDNSKALRERGVKVGQTITIKSS